MKFPNSLAARSLAASLFLAAVSLLPAQSVVTEPVGFTTLTVNAKPANIRGFTYLSLNMFRPTVYRSLVTSAASVGGFTVLTFPANSFTANQFTGTGNVCFVEITNGSAAGTLVDITANTTNTITLAEDVTSSVSNGVSTIRVRPHWTFATVFGVNNSAGLLGGTSAAAADTVQTLNPSTGLRTTYFYNTTSAQWQTGFSNANNAIIRPDGGLIVERKLTTAVPFTLVGEVKLGPTEVVIVGGTAGGNLNLVPNPYPLASTRLADIGLYTGNTSTGLAGGSSAATADTVGVFNSTTGLFTTYFYNTTAAHWQTGFSDATNTTLPEGSAIIITRKGGLPTFSWFIPQPAMNL